MNFTLKKDEIVTVVSVTKNNTVLIQNTKVVSCGAKMTRFECFDGFFETPTIFPTIESMEENIHCYICIAPNEDFINRYIQVAKKEYTKGLERVEEYLQKEPNSERYKSHLKLFENEVSVKDLRDISNE